MKTRRNKRSSTNRRNGSRVVEDSETIPLDLIIEILTRLPAKSIARFRCVSKLWESTLRSPIFTDSFFTISLSRPKLLFTCLLEGKTLFFTSPQPQNTSSITSNFHMSFSSNHSSEKICRPVRGLVCGLYTVSVPFICNPSTGQSFTLPKVKTKTRNKVRSYLGYDPIDKQFKVLCMTLSLIESDEHQVLTLGPGKKLSWRMIKCDIPHYPCDSYDGLCINGVLYYFTWLRGGDDELYEIVSFDIRSEKFNCIQKARGMRKNLIPCTDLWSTLVDYKGKLAMLQPNIVDRVYTGIQLWVLEDAEKHQWSNYIYDWTPLWESIDEDSSLCFVGTTSGGEIVLSVYFISSPSYLLYYNPKKNTITRVDIQGMEAFKNHKVHIFLDHVEDVKLMETV